MIAHKKHGGAREGAGRPKGAPNKTPAVTPTRKRYALRLSAETGAWIEAQAKQAGKKPTPFLEQLIEGLAKKERLT